MKTARWTALGAIALLVGTLGAPAAQAAKPTPVVKAFSFAPAELSVNESDWFVPVTVQRNVTKGKATVTVQASIGGGDTASSDEIDTFAQTASFSANQAEATVFLFLPDDDVDEPDETFTVSVISTSKGYTGANTLTVTILDDEAGPPPPPVNHAGTFTVPPGHVASFVNVNINSCNDLRLRAVSGGETTPLTNNGGGACNTPATPTVTAKVVNNTLSPITMHVELVDDSCGATFGSDHTGAGNGDGADHARVLEIDSNNYEIDFHDGGVNECERVGEDAIPDTNDGDAQIDVSISASPVDTGIWIVPDGWEMRIDQFVLGGCFNSVEGHLVIDGVDTVTLAAAPSGGDCYSQGLDDWIQKNTSGATWLVQFVLEDVTCSVRYSTSHTSTGGSESVDHAWNHDVNGSDYQVAIAHAGKDCVNEDVDVFPGFDGPFLPHFDVYQSSF